MISLYCTPAKIDMESGGGAAAVNELAALRSVSDVELILGEDEFAPWHHKVGGSPFLEDYFALEQIRNKHFDLAHFYGGCFTQTARLLKERGTKISWMVAAHDRKVSIEEFHRLGLEYPFLHMIDADLFQIYSEGYRLADIVLSQSQRGAEILKGMGCKRVEVVPGGIIWPKDVKPIPENFDVAYIGALGPDKGVVYVLQAWGILNYPDSKLLLAGSGTETLEPFIRKITDKGNFVLLGRVSDVASVYNSCSVYVQPSVTEGFGLEIPEAMSYGRPVIAAEGAGAAELIQDGITGYIVPIREPHAIARSIDLIRGDRKRMLDMGHEARRKARSYTWDKIRKLYVKVFLEVGNGNRIP